MKIKKSGEIPLDKFIDLSLYNKKIGYYMKKNPFGKKGDFITEDGQTVGTHQGYPFYTIGQRKGLGLALGYPIYVTNIDVEKNTVTVGTFDELKRNGMYVDKLNFMKYDNIDGRLNAYTKIRYNDSGNPSVIEKVGDTMKVYFGAGVNAITPGQAAVFYEDNDVIGGGWIKSSFNQNKIKSDSNTLIKND